MNLTKVFICCLLSLAPVVATSIGRQRTPSSERSTSLQTVFWRLVDRLAGKLVKPKLLGKLGFGNQGRDSGRVLKRRRTRRDLAYAQQLLDLLISVETALERWGVEEPQCQLKATCEIHKRNANAIGTEGAQANFIKLVSEMRREIQNPRVVPLAKYVFEYYEEAAVRGEQQSDCAEMYAECEDSMEPIFRRTKGKKSRRLY